MKELWVLRHAKSSWKQEGLDDHDRPLNRRGKQDAPRMGALIAREPRIPQRILSSTAVRARTTAAAVAESCAFEGELSTTRELYMAGPLECFRVLGELGGSADPILLVGHNPGMEELVEMLTGRSEVMPTAALARIALELDEWIELTEVTRGKLLGLWRPRELPG